MAVDFDGVGKVTLPAWRAAGDFTIAFSDITVSDGAKVFLGNNSSSSSEADAISFANGRLRLFAGTLGNSVDVGPVYPVGTSVAVTIQRVGDTITATIDSSSATITDDSEFYIDEFGNYSSADSLDYNETIAGTVTFTDVAGGDNRSYDFNQAAGSLVLPDSVGNQNGNLIGFTTGGFDGDGVIDLEAGVKVYALIGQSMMVGADDIESGIDDNYANLSNVYQYGFDARSLSVATNPLDHSNSSSDTSTTMGSWRTMMLQLKASGVIASGEASIVVPAAKSGTSFPSWAPGGAEYEAAVIRINEALALNSGNTMGAVIFDQGTSNFGDTAVEREANLNLLRNGLITDVALITDETIFIIVNKNSNAGSTPANVTAMNEGNASFAAQSSRIGIVDAEGLTLLSDDIHIDAASTRIIGTRTGEAIDAILNPSIPDLIVVSGQSFSVNENSIVGTRVNNSVSGLPAQIQSAGGGTVVSYSISGTAYAVDAQGYIIVDELNTDVATQAFDVTVTDDTGVTSLAESVLVSTLNVDETVTPVIPAVNKTISFDGSDNAQNATIATIVTSNLTTPLSISGADASFFSLSQEGGTVSISAAQELPARSYSAILSGSNNDPEGGFSRPAISSFAVSVIVNTDVDYAYDTGLCSGHKRLRLLKDGVTIGESGIAIRINVGQIIAGTPSVVFVSPSGSSFTITSSDNLTIGQSGFTDALGCYVEEGEHLFYPIELDRFNEAGEWNYRVIDTLDSGPRMYDPVEFLVKS